MREKRKPTSAQRLDAEKRQCMSWDMYDASNHTSGDGQTKDPDTPLQNSTGKESVPGQESVPGPSRTSELSFPGDDSPFQTDDLFLTENDLLGHLPAGTSPYQINRARYNHLRATTAYQLKFHTERPTPKECCGLLCCLDIDLSSASPVTSPQPFPEALTSRAGGSLLFGDAPGSDFLILDEAFHLTESSLMKDPPPMQATCTAFSMTVRRRPSSSCLEGLQELHQRKGGRLLRLCLRDYDNESGRVVMDVWLLAGILAQPAFAAHCPGKKQFFCHVHHVMNWFLGFPVPASQKMKIDRRYNYTALFDRVYQYHRTQETVDLIDVQHPVLVPELRPYQRDAVRWMVMKENIRQDEEDQLHLLWRRVKTLDGKVLYYNPHSGEMTAQKQVMPAVFPGGILADEMGLGKTVEVLALILAHPRWNKTFSGGLGTSSQQEEGPCAMDFGHCGQEEDILTSNSLQDSVNDELDAGEGEENKAMSHTEVKGQQDCEQERDGDDKTTACREGGVGMCNTEGDLIQTREENGEKDKSHAAKPDIPEQSPIKALGSGHDVEENHKQTETVVSTPHPPVGGDSSTQSHVAGSALAAISVDGTNQKESSANNNGEAPVESEGNAESNFSALPPILVGGTDRGRNTYADTGEVSQIDRSECARSTEKTQLRKAQQNDSGINVQYANDGADTSDRTTFGLEPETPVPVSLAGVDDGTDPDRVCPPDETESVTSNETLDYAGLLDERRVFQCTCGEDASFIYQPLCVRCLACQTWQHASCVGFDSYMPDNPTEHVQYWCPHCLLLQPPIVSGATLIISPASICQQWVDEINRHISSTKLKVMVYEGVKKQKFLQPRNLAECDIVMTTYAVLRAELDFANLPHPGKEGRNLRHTKRYMTAPSPMPCIEWWRICLDEAQMIECPTAKSAEMANRLSAVNRWCVTGTPIQKSLDDLYGLFLFLGVEPYWVRHWWNILLSAPFSRGDTEPLQKALCRNFWRSAKKDVLEQIAIPPQTETVHWLDFSPIETHFYQRQHEECSRSFTQYSLKTSVLPDTKLATLDRKLLQRLLGPLLRVRQACCHPHVVRGVFSSLQKKKELTMQSLLTNMIGRAEQESDGSHRQLVCALNGLAAIHCIKDQVREAVELYREVLQSAQDQRDDIKTDKLQLLHAMHNMQELLNDRSEVVQPRPEDSDLPQKMSILREEYLIRTENQVVSSQLAVQPIRNKVQELIRKVPPGPPWYLDGIQWVIYQGLGPELVERLKTELEAKSDVMGLADKFGDARGFEYILVAELTGLKELYQKAWKGVTSLHSRLKDNQLLMEATDCHLRPFKGRARHTCAFCQVEDQLQSYEMKLFSFDPRNLDASDLPSTSTTNGPSTSSSSSDQGPVNPLTAGPRGTWAASETEKALRILLSFLRSVHTEQHTLEEGAAHLELLEQQRKEFKPLRAFWGAMRDRVAARDELEMAMLRLRVKLPGEEVDPASQPYIIEPLAVEQERYKFLNDQLVARNELRRKRGQLVYLKNLRKAQYDLKDGRNPEPCPICVRPLGQQWTVLQCGHCFCSDCMDTMLRRSVVAGRQGSVKCAVCRLPTEGAEVSYVSVAPSQGPPREENSLKVEGDHSTKIEAVVRTLKLIERKEPGAKAIVFSTWAEVLELISKALTMNHIGFRNAGKSGGHKHFQAALLDFKLDPAITVLLLPVHSGSKGLNLIEATHVLLVEPILNPASELQAVGRVHRIGQTKPTVVHRFLIHETIEEKLHTYLRTHTIRDGLSSSETATGDMTLADLRALFALET